jgi:small subunit ribosomal protein S17e
MGRIRTSYIKRISHMLMSDHRDKFTTDFEHNKKILKTIEIAVSKKTRNRIAGYITHLMKRSKV